MSGHNDTDKVGMSGCGPRSDKASRRFLDVSDFEDLTEGMSLDLIVSESISGKSYETRTNAKNSKKASSSDEDEASSGNEREAISTDVEDVIVNIIIRSSKGKPFKTNIIL